jgi:hypothetical protein
MATRIPALSVILRDRENNPEKSRQSATASNDGDQGLLALRSPKL